MSSLFKKFSAYDKSKPQVEAELGGILGLPVSKKTVEVPGRNGYVYVRLRNNSNEIVQARNDQVSPVYDLPVLLVRIAGGYKVKGRDIERYQDWGSFSSFLPRHAATHQLTNDLGAGGDVAFIYSRQFMPFATIPSGTNGAGSVFIEPHVYRNPVDASWNYVGNQNSVNLLPAKPLDGNARTILLYWDLDVAGVRIATGSVLSTSLTGTADILSSLPLITSNRQIPLTAVRLVSGTSEIVWDNIYDLRQFATTTPPSFTGGFAVQDEGTFVTTGTTLNFVGAGVDASVSGSVIRVHISGSVGIGGQDEGVALGNGTILNFVGPNVDASRSGTVIRVFVTGSVGGSGGGISGIIVRDDGVPVGTGTIIDFRTEANGPSIDVSISGTVIDVYVYGTANQSLSNLGATAVNDNLVSQSDMTLYIGDVGNHWLRGYFGRIDAKKQTGTSSPASADQQLWADSSGTWHTKYSSGFDAKLLANNGLLLVEGSNQTMGVATLAAGTVTVNTTKVTANSRIFLTTQSLGTILRPAGLGVSARVAGTSFTIMSTDITDTSTVAWVIMEPS